MGKKINGELIIKSIKSEFPTSLDYIESFRLVSNISQQLGIILTKGETEDEDVSDKILIAAAPHFTEVYISTLVKNEVKQIYGSS